MPFAISASNSASGFLGGRVDVCVSELRPHRHLLGIEFAGLGQAGDRGIVILSLHGGHAGRERVVEFLVLLHRLFAFFDGLS